MCFNCITEAREISDDVVRDGEDVLYYVTTFHLSEPFWYNLRENDLNIKVKCAESRGRTLTIRHDDLSDYSLSVESTDCRYRLAHVNYDKRNIFLRLGIGVSDICYNSFIR